MQRTTVIAADTGRAGASDLSGRLFAPAGPNHLTLLLRIGRCWPTDVSDSTHHIGTLNEKPLHAALKDYYAQPGDRFEVPVDGFHIDLVRGDLLVEFQTAGFSAIRRKIEALLPDHPVRLVHPVAEVKWIVKLDRAGTKQLYRRKSPKKGCVDDLFEELVSLPALLANENFSLEVLMIHEEEVRRDQRRRRKSWRRHERRLLEVVDRWVFESPEDLADLLPDDLPEPFTTGDLAEQLNRPRWLTQKMAYCLRESGAITPTGKRGNALLYTREAIPVH